jgi:hypothetical protein
MVRESLTVTGEEKNEEDEERTDSTEGPQSEGHEKNRAAANFGWRSTRRRAAALQSRGASHAGAGDSGVRRTRPRYDLGGTRQGGSVSEEISGCSESEAIRTLTSHSAEDLWVGSCTDPVSVAVTEKQGQP